VLLTPGYRNIKSSSNILFDIALPHINAKLTTYGFPIIADVKLLRLVDPCPNYATLSREERAATSLITDHILPGEELYKNRRLHMIYGDDIFITGESSERAKKDALSKGGMSFLSVFAMMMDGETAGRFPGVEEVLNGSHVTGRLDGTALEILIQPDLVPVIRTLRLLLCEENSSDLPDFLAQIPADNALKVYEHYMANESMNESRFSGGLEALRRHLCNLGLVAPDGLLVWK
jgi:hypothetical protein